MTEGLLKDIAHPEEEMSEFNLDLTIDHLVVYEKPKIPGEHYGYDVTKRGVEEIKRDGIVALAEHNLADELQAKLSELDILAFRANEDDEPEYEKYYVFYISDLKKGE